MVEFQRFINSDQTSFIRNDNLIIRVVILHGSWSKVDLISYSPVKFGFNQNLSLTFIGWQEQTCLTTSFEAKEFNFADCGQDFVSG